MYYEVLFVEDGLWYINFYEYGFEYKPTKVKLNKHEFEKWKIGKIEK